MLKLKRTFLCQMSLLCSLVLLPLSAFAGTISVVSAGGTAFTLMASGFPATHGFQLTVNYDTAHFSNPRVVQGSLTSGAMNAVNANVPGTVRMALVSISPMKGSGPIATITFDPVGDPGGTISVSGTVIDLNGKYLSASFSGWSASSGSGTADASNPGSTTPPVSTTTGGTSTGSPSVVGGTLTMPTDDSATRERKEAAGQPVKSESSDIAGAAPASSEAPVAPEASPKEAQAYIPTPVQSVLEKFRLFTGDKTPKNLVALFDRAQGAPFSQFPPVCIADGKASVQVIIPKVTGDKDPNFTFNHASYLSLKQAGDGEWQVVVRPDKGALRASISMLTDGGQQEIPLTVSPSVDIDLNKSGTVSEADFLLFLKTRGTDAAPKFDLNKDGKRDYQDDYIFTANYLAMKAARDKK